MTNRLTKAQLRNALGVDTDAAIADFFEISRSAVAQWGDDEPIPELRQLQAERKCPGLCGAMDQDIEPGPQLPAAEAIASAAGSTDAMSEAA